MNEMEVQWIDKQDWIYEAHFEINEDQLQCQCVELVLEGLDTYADVKVNGQYVLSANNMFRVWRQDVKAIVQQGKIGWKSVFVLRLLKMYPSWKA